MEGVLVFSGCRVSWSRFSITNFSILSLSLRTAEGDFLFAADPWKVLPSVGLMWEAGILTFKVANSAPFLVSRNSVAQSPLRLHSWKASRSTLMVLSPVMFLSFPTAGTIVAA